LFTILLVFPAKINTKRLPQKLQVKTLMQIKLTSQNGDMFQKQAVLIKY
jgi:hypothetical protein